MTTKRDLYARAGVPEYWVVDLNARRLIVYKGLAEGTYEEISAFGENNAVSIEGCSVGVGTLLP
jgi:Uma2 family endonuclease